MARSWRVKRRGYVTGFHKHQALLGTCDKVQANWVVLDSAAHM